MELKYKNWSEISIKKYYELESLSNDESLEGEEKDMEIVACLCESTVDEISRIPYPDYVSLKRQLRFLGNFKFDTEKDLKELEVKGRKYRVCRDFSKFTTAQYIDFQTLYTQDNLKDNYGLVLSTFVLPKDVKEYNTGYDVVEEAKFLYENLDICRANQLMFFFRKRWHNSMIVTMNYLKFLAKRNLKKKSLRDEEKEMWTKVLEETQHMPGLDSLI